MGSLEVGLTLAVRGPMFRMFSTCLHVTLGLGSLSFLPGGYFFGLKKMSKEISRLARDMV